MRNEEIRMHKCIKPLLADNTSATVINEYAIKRLRELVEGS
jgi:hypothetical protein